MSRATRLRAIQLAGANEKRLIESHLMIQKLGNAEHLASDLIDISTYSLA
jgi:hypothetical protein